MMRRDDGFTLVEIGVIVPIIMVLAIALFSTMFSYLLSSNRQQAQLDQTYSQTTALSRIETNVRLSTAYLSTTDSSVTDGYAPSGGWKYSGSDANHRVLILREFSTGDNPLSNVRTPVYLMTPTAPDCSQSSYISGPLTYDIVYFIDQSTNTLYKRTLTNATTRTCGTQYQKRSCPLTATVGSNGCGAYDEVVATNAAGLSVDYYATQASATPLDAYNASGSLTVAKSVGVTITNSQRSYNGTVSTSSSLRMTSQNARTGGPTS